MVKGISRRVIVVRSPDPRYFEQGIFMMKEEAFHKEGVTAEQVIQEAQQAAAGYLRRTGGHKRQRVSIGLPWWVWFTLGACLMGLVWLVSGMV